MIDPKGLSPWGCGTGDNPPGNSTTVVCDGNGGFDVHEGWSRSKPNPIRSCAYEHEMTHVFQILGKSPKVCRGKPKGVRVLVPSHKYKQWECAAYKAELQCLQNSSCENEQVKERIDFIKNQRIPKYCN